MPGIGDLVANLTVDNTGFKKGLTQASSSLKSFGSSIGGLVAPVAGALAAVWGTSASVSGFKDSLKSQQMLATVLKNTGNAAGFTSEEISKYAADLQKTTNFEDDATVAAAAMLAGFTNIRGDNFKGAIAAAMDLSTVMGGDLKSNVELLGKVLNDPSEGLGKLRKAGIQLTDQQEKQITTMQKAGDIAGAQGVILGAIASKFGGAAQAVADPWTQLKNTMGDVGENIGSLLLPSISTLGTALSGMLETVVGGGDAFKALGIEAAVVLSHTGGLLVLAATQWELFFVKIGSEASHFFTETLPTYTSWFGDNLQNIVGTAAANTLTIIQNLGENIATAVKAAFDWEGILSGTKPALVLKPLMDGMINLVSNLPNVPERVVGDFEKSLVRDIDAMSEHLGESMSKQRAELEAKFSPGKNMPTGVSPGVDAGKAPKPKELKAAFVGSQEAASLLLRGVNGPKTTEQILEKALTVQQLLLAATRANKPQEFQPVTLGT